MASSSYWKKLRDQENDRIKQIKSKIEALKSIKKNIENGLPDNVTDVNKTINDVNAEITNSLKHDAVYKRNADELLCSRESNVQMDKNLSAAKTELEVEIGRLEQSKKEAESDRDRYDQKYRDAKEEEQREARERHEAAINSVINGLQNLFR